MNHYLVLSLHRDLKGMPQDIAYVETMVAYTAADVMLQWELKYKNNHHRSITAIYPWPPYEELRECVYTHIREASPFYAQLVADLLDNK